MSTKRKPPNSPPVPSSSMVVKRSKMDIVPVNAQILTVSSRTDRTSALQAPIMALTGHGAAINSLQFDGSGKVCASASFDRSILLWQVYGDCRNYGLLKGHQNAILQVQWTYDDKQLISASADKTVALWDAEMGVRVKKWTGHSSVVNSVSPVRKGPMIVASGSNDGTAKLWDPRQRPAVSTFEHKYAVTAVCMADDGVSCFAGNLDGTIKMWDLRNEQVALELVGHEDIITSLSLSPDGSHIMSNAMDNTVRKWDVRPYVQGDRCTGTFLGAKHNLDRTLIKGSWSPCGSQIICGSSDRNVYIWDSESTELKYVLPGHKGAVHEACFHPKEPIIGSCGNDKVIYLGELVP